MGKNRIYIPKDFSELFIEYLVNIIQSNVFHD